MGKKKDIDRENLRVIEMVSGRHGERKRKRDGQTDRGRDREREREIESDCVSKC